ncbi:hypothetical protein [Pseudobacteriovorax antillogorgiicola]|uniref:Uncharacterized protein n=1 Tax=Pseudobacteriovorax antillogorgiicola TaxID=1513793 RepID=A0A1Y6BIR2_9BACT|nr:hypothetical protein [Pseudobacteriovorax antillogorgiicola]TCS57290.1 hypothetical protein EDD56_10330 [Pseudobacteriovorax antillogorgiicola]SMF03005.1 hypothetical protein SAMN06296036_103303 [Pseudobacteriovorax antillogorgiicola]
MGTDLLSILPAMVVFIGLQFALHELARRFVVSATVLFVLMLSSIPFWNANLDGWFRWAKSISVLVPTVLLFVARIAHRRPHPKLDVFEGKWLMWVAYAVLMLNIAEATIKDVTLGNYWNSIVGVIVAATIPIKPRDWYIERDSKFNDFLFSLPTLWCVLYTTWNICFVYGERTEFTAHVFSILMVPLAYSVIMKRPDLWYSARVTTLASSLFFRSAYDVVTPYMDTSSWANAKVTQTFGLINLALAFAYLGYLGYRKKNSKTQVTDEPSQDEAQPTPLPHSESGVHSKVG